jgi:type II secretory pathway component GspD/PulD (secretin)
MPRFILLILFLAISPASHAVYKCQDANGKIEYRAEPCAAGNDVTPLSVKNITSKEKKYVGENIKLNFESIDIRSLLQIIGDFTGKKMRIDNAVQGNVAAHYAGPWNQVLDQIAAHHGLIVLVEPYSIGVRNR